MTLTCRHGNDRTPRYVGSRTEGDAVVFVIEQPICWDCFHALDDSAALRKYLAQPDGPVDGGRK